MGQSAAAVAVDSLTKGQAFLVTQLSNQTSVNSDSNQTSVSSDGAVSSPFEVLNEDDIAPVVDLLPVPPKSKAAKVANVRASKATKPKHPAPSPPLDKAAVAPRVKKGGTASPREGDISPSSWEAMKKYFGYSDDEAHRKEE